MSKKFLDNTGLTTVVTKVKELLAKKVDVVSGKGLSTNDFTGALKTKLEGIEAGAQVNKIEAISVNGEDATITEKKVALTIPDVSGFQTAEDVETLLSGKGYQTKAQVEATVTGKGYQTASDVSTAIANAIKGIQGIKYSVVETLGETGEAGTIYLVSNKSEADKNIYDEYIWVTDKFEKLGTTEMDLSGYMKTADMVEITETEINALFE